MQDCLIGIAQETPKNTNKARIKNSSDAPISHIVSADRDKSMDTMDMFQIDVAKCSKFTPTQKKKLQVTLVDVCCCWPIGWLPQIKKSFELVKLQ
eukprot:scaffold421393_cov50-Prasinocladus_malaysianus.AAC.1